MKIPTASSATSFQRGQISLRSLMPRLPRSNVYSTRDPENPSASVHRKRSLTPSLALKFLCTGELNPRTNRRILQQINADEVFGTHSATGDAMSAEVQINRASRARLAQMRT